MAADVMVDSAGAAIVVGDTVKLVGVITALNPFDNRYNDVTVALSHVAPFFGGDNQAPLGITGGDPTVPGLRIVVTVPPGFLTKGA